MKRITVILLVAALVAGLASCGDGTTDAAPEEPTDAAGTGIMVENAFYFTHVNGHREEQEMVAYVPFEYEQLQTVKYQVVYVACTCRPPNDNYHSVAFVELSKSDGSIVDISYDWDRGDHYTAGLYGDSYVSWDGEPVYELFSGYIEDVLMGASQDAINAIEPMHGQVDGFTGATVTPNNAVRMLQGLFRYHNERYMNA